MVTFVAVYQGPHLGESEIVEVSSDPLIVDQTLFGIRASRQQSADIRGNPSPSLKLVISNDHQGENND